MISQVSPNYTPKKAPRKKGKDYMKDVTYHNLRTKIPHTKTEYNMEISISPFDYSKLSSHFLGNYCHRQWHGPRFNDARLACLNSKYFHNKQVLEVGCNDGQVSIEIAIKYYPAQIKGIDIDQSLISRSEREVLKFINKNECYQRKKEETVLVEKVQSLPFYFQQHFERYFREQICIGANVELGIPGIQVINEFPNNINFECENVFRLQADREYDTVVCFGVTRWIHLAFGDEGLRELFDKLYALLKPNGFLILEYQLWPSYRKKKNMNEVYKAHYEQITISPDNFPSMLTTIGLQIIEEFYPRLHEELQHPIAIFRKLL